MSYEDLERARVERTTKEAESEANMAKREARKVAIITQDAEEEISGERERGSKRKTIVSSSYTAKPRAKVRGAAELQGAGYEQEVDALESENLAASLCERRTKTCAIGRGSWRAPFIRMW